MHSDRANAKNLSFISSSSIGVIMDIPMIDVLDKSTIILYFSTRPRSRYERIQLLRDFGNDQARLVPEEKCNFHRHEVFLS